MPRVLPDLDLSRDLTRYVRDAHQGNKARASEALSVTRPVLYRALRGSVTRATADAIRAKLRRHGNSAFTERDGATVMPDNETLHNIPEIALQVLRFMTQAVQHERLPNQAQPDA